MGTILERLNQELEQIGKRAQAAIDEGKLQLELLRLRRQRDNASGDLGRLVYKRERGGEVEPARVDALLLRLDDIEAAIDKVEHQMRSVKAEAVVEEEPAEAQQPESPPGAEEGSPS